VYSFYNSWIQNARYCTATQSVRPGLTLWYFVKTAKHIVEIYSPPNRSIILGHLVSTGSPQRGHKYTSAGNINKGLLKVTGGHVRYISTNISETMATNIALHSKYNILSNSATTNDLEWPLKVVLKLLTLWSPLLPYGYKPSFVIFDIRALWRSALSARVPACQKLQMTA